MLSFFFFFLIKRTLQMSTLPKKNVARFSENDDWLQFFLCAARLDNLFECYIQSQIHSRYSSIFFVFFLAFSLCFSCVWIFYGVRVGLYFCVFILRFVEKLAAIIVCVFWSLSLLLDIRGIGHLNVVFPSKALLCGGTLSISATIAIATVSATATAVADTQWK